MMPLSDTVRGKIAIAAIISKQEGGDPRLVRLKRKNHHLKHDSDMLVIFSGNPVGWRFHTRIRRRTYALSLLDLALDFPHASHVFIELLLVVSP